MEIKEVAGIPLSNKGMNENAQKTLDRMRDMEVGKTLEFSDEKRTVQSMVSSIKNLSKRLATTCKFTIRARNNAVYVEKTEDLTKTPKTENKETTDNKAKPKKK